MGTVQFFDSSGNAVTLTAEGQTSSTFNYAIAPRSSQRFRTAGSAASVQTGSVRVVPAGNGTSPGGLVIFSTRQGGVTVAEASIAAASSGSAFRLYVEASGDFARGLFGSIQTGVAISNPASTPVTVTLELRRLDGSATGLTATIQIPANGQVSRFIYQIPALASLQLPFQGVLRITSPTPVSVAGLRGRLNERREFLITTTPPADEAAPATNAALFFPHFAEGGGYTTQFTLFSSSTSGVLRFVGQSGSALNLSLH
jgi:hypothetical protein